MREIWVDGYNLIRQSERHAEQERRGGLEAGRLSLLRALAAYQKATGDRVTVVFDGDEGIGCGTGLARRDGVSVVFSRPPDSADDALMDRVRRSHGKKEMLVVSSDRKIVEAARRNRIAASSSEAFEAEMTRRIAEGVRGPHPPPKRPIEPDPEEVAYWERAFRTEKGMFEKGTE